MAEVYKRLKRGWDYLNRKFAEDVTLNHITSESLDTHDVPTETTTSTTEKAVVYGTDTEYMQQEFGDLQSGDFIFLFKSGVTVSDRDNIVYRSETYQVRRSEPLYTNGGLVGTVAYTQRRS